jgi:hypothetical protein
MIVGIMGVMEVDVLAKQLLPFGFTEGFKKARREEAGQDRLL